MLLKRQLYRSSVYVLPFTVAALFASACTNPVSPGSDDLEKFQPPGSNIAVPTAFPTGFGIDGASKLNSIAYEVSAVLVRDGNQDAWGLKITGFNEDTLEPFEETIPMSEAEVLAIGVNDAEIEVSVEDGPLVNTGDSVTICTQVVRFTPGGAKLLSEETCASL